jgi:PTS system nitrogen regulatory IIA component
MTLGWFKKKLDKHAKTPSPTPPSSSAHPVLPKGLSVGKLLNEHLVVVPTQQDKDQMIEFLVRRLCQVRSLGDPYPFLAKILEREQGISTTLDTGLAVPHARMEALSGIAAVLGLVPHGLPDPKQPDLVIRAMFLFFSPNRQEAFTQHLHLLRAVSALFQPAFIEEILRNPVASVVLSLIRAKETAT